MVRFANTPRIASKSAPTSVGSHPTAQSTFESGQGFKASNPHVELFNACVNGFLSNGFYESADARIQRMRALVPQCDQEWVAHFARWLRLGGNMRSASILVAAEYAAHFPNTPGLPTGRQVVASVIQRADEPAEMIGYWRAFYSRTLKPSVQRGIADALRTVYTEFSALKYDGVNNDYRFGDVIEIVHPKPADDYRSDLYRWLLDRRRDPKAEVPERLKVVQSVRNFEAVPEGQRRGHVLARMDEPLPKGVTWERLAGWLPGGMDADAWVKVLPNMGHMAIVRNLNNFDRAGVDPAIVRPLLKETAEQSRMLPYRYFSAYQNQESDNFKVILDELADDALKRLPQFEGSTLIMVDCSGSMSWTYSQKSKIYLSQIAAFFAETLARRCEQAEIATYNYSVRSVHSPMRHVSAVKAATDQVYRPGGGTHTWAATAEALQGRNPNRVFIITDEQTMGRDNLADDKPIITWNLAGIKTHQAAHGRRNRFLVCGVNDNVMSTLPTVMAVNSSGKWPWETGRV